jgi:putative DNA primase/helicase
VQPNNMTEHGVHDIMANAGMPCYEPLLMDGVIHRYQIDGRGKRNGWYFLIERDGRIFGMAGNWKNGDRVRIGKYDMAMRRAVRKIEVARVDDSLRAAIAARDEWAGLDASGESEYLKRKGVPGFGLRYAGNYVAVPMFRGRDGGMVGLQRIMPDGKKLFTKGCAKKGASYDIHGGGDAIVVCEGYATGASIHMATGFWVVVAFDCGNLMPVANRLRADLPKGKIIIAADHDHATPGNPGVTAASAAALAIRASVAVPPEGLVGTDFNDVHQEMGLTAVAASLYDAL